ncbi:MAG: ribulokinase, partial [Lentisphaeria bacterium]|nr:ribulokinase [Lentisphaeria bacterium]
WISGVLTGCTDVKKLIRTRCAAGHKAMWHPSWGGLPPEEFFCGIDPLLQGLRGRLYEESIPAGQKAGCIAPAWAEKLGLNKDVVIATGSLDCHAGAVGAGIRKGVLVKVFGTSTCDILVADPVKKCIPGICGQVNGSVVPGMEGLEAGQSAFGDIYNSFRRFLADAGAQITLPELEKQAMELPADPNGVFALDFFNGRRSPYANPVLTGSLFGMNLGTTPGMIYRALVEATCCGARHIVEHLQNNGLELHSITGVGGISRKSVFVMQTCADLFQMPIEICASDQVCSLGSAMFAATASGLYPTLEKAMENMKPGCDRCYKPDPAKKEVYDAIYQRYLRFSAALETLR